MCDQSNDGQSGVNVVPTKTLSTLDLDCLDEIFDWLTLDDLLIVSRTCKRIQWAAGDYFQTNYAALRAEAKPDGIYVQYNGRNRQINDFYHFIPYIHISLTQHPDYQLYSLQNLQKHGNKSLKRIDFDCGLASPMYIDRFKDQFKSIETFIIDGANLNQETYEKIRSNCVNLKRLCFRNTRMEATNGQPFQKYHDLEHFEWSNNWRFILSNIEDQFKIPLLKTFLAENLNMRSFTTTVNCFLENRHIFIECDNKFDVLHIKFEPGENRNSDFLYHFLNECYAKGVYKSLHLSVLYITEPIIDQIKMLHALNKLKINYTSDRSGGDISDLVQLREISIVRLTELHDINGVAKKCVNLEKILTRQATIDQILPFIRQSPKLIRIKVYQLSLGTHFNRNILDILSKVNKERKQLKGASKITLYVSDTVYVATKYAIRQINRLDMIEIKRAESYK